MTITFKCCHCPTSLLVNSVIKNDGKTIFVNTCKPAILHTFKYNRTCFIWLYFCYSVFGEKKKKEHNCHFDIVMDVWKWHSHLKGEIKRPALLKQNDIYGIFSLCEFCVRETALKGKMTVVSSAESSLAAEIRCYATRISKVCAAPGSHFSVCLHRLGRNWWLLIMHFFLSSIVVLFEKLLCKRIRGVPSRRITQDVMNLQPLITFLCHIWLF